MTEHAVAILELKIWGGHCGAKENVGGQHKCRSCMVIFRCFEDEFVMVNPIRPNIGLCISSSPKVMIGLIKVNGSVVFHILLFTDS